MVNDDDDNQELIPSLVLKPKLANNENTNIPYNATYLASVDDIAVQSCFFDIQLTNLSPRNFIPLDVLL
nr:hypothetical protein [Tanacetum cinerariifolium]